MNEITIYLIEVTATLVICVGVVAYLRQSLRPILVDLCGSEERARFWVTFASILLIGLPIVFAMGYNPLAGNPDGMFFDVANQIKRNLLGFLLTLMGIGAIISFFALIAPRPKAQP